MHLAQGILHGDLTANNILLASLNGVDESSPSSSDDGSPRGPLIAKVRPSSSGKRAFDLHSI